MNGWTVSITSFCAGVACCKLLPPLIQRIALPDMILGYRSFCSPEVRSKSKKDENEHEPLTESEIQYINTKVTEYLVLARKGREEIKNAKGLRSLVKFGPEYPPSEDKSREAYIQRQINNKYYKNPYATEANK